MRAWSICAPQFTIRLTTFSIYWTKRNYYELYAKLVSNSFSLSLGAANHALDFIICARFHPFFPIAHFYEQMNSICARLCQLSLRAPNWWLPRRPFAANRRTTYLLYNWQRIDVKNIHRDADSLYYCNKQMKIVVDCALFCGGIATPVETTNSRGLYNYNCI